MALRIDYDHDALKIIDNVNKLLESHGLRFEDDGEVHDGWVVYHLKHRPTVEQLKERFAHHCRCRPLDFARTADDHASCHDCDTGVLADIQALLQTRCAHERIKRVIGDPKNPHAHVCECGKVIKFGPRHA